MAENDEIVMGLKQLNINLNQLNDFFLILVKELGEKNIINEKEIKIKFNNLLSSLYQIKGNIEYKYYNMEEKL